VLGGPVDYGELHHLYNHLVYSIIESSYRPTAEPDQKQQAKSEKVINNVDRQRRARAQLTFFLA